MIEIEQTVNPTHNMANSPRRLYVVNNKDDYTRQQLLLIYLYKIVFHIFVFSIFESFFFWFYITDQENNALKKQIGELEMISNLICNNVDIDLDPYYEFIKNERNNFNNDVPLNNTLVLNFYLLGILSLINCILKIGRVDIISQNYIVMKESSLLFILLFVYEFMFFNNVIYLYKPKSMVKIAKMFFKEC
tara:strand:+ start:624 stop:1193 length:570 start_codon:yes stop_codon:yes gene_type:complete